MIILASQSPRRKELLKEILGDIPFICIPSSLNEREISETDVRKLCLEEALCKGEVVSLAHMDDIVISADTMVSYKGIQLGKPKDEEDARRMLRLITGDVHEVITAYAIFKGGKVQEKRVCRARVYLEKMADLEIEEYLDTLSPLDKAGAYGIQDKDFIESKILSGSYETIVGLPIDELEEDLVKLGIIE